MTKVTSAVTQSARRWWTLGAAIGGALLTATAITWRCGLLKADFWPGLLANLIATSFGIVVGIPVALAISRRQQAAVDRATELQRAQAAEQLDERVTRVLVEEFHENVDH